MTKKTWLTADQRDTPITDEKTTADSLWTRRSALALTAGFVAMSSAPGNAAYHHVLRPRADHVVISKKHRMLELHSGSTILRRYRVSLGFTPDGHKARSGDGRTPEGRYFIDRRNPRSEFYLSLGINYPNATDLARARAMGVNPGGDIFIHGEPVRGERRRGRDWTAGCIAVKNDEIEEIWSMVPTGVPVTIFGAG